MLKTLKKIFNPELVDKCAEKLTKINESENAQTIKTIAKNGYKKTIKKLQELTS